MKRPTTLAELSALTPSASLQLARQSVQDTPKRPTRRRRIVRAITGPTVMVAVLLGGTSLASALTGGHPF